MEKSQEKYSKSTVSSLPCVQWGCSDAFGRRTWSWTPHYTPAGRSDSTLAQGSTGCTVCDSVYVSNNNLTNWLIDAFFLTAVQSCGHVNHVLNFVFLSARSFSQCFWRRDVTLWNYGLLATNSQGESEDSLPLHVTAAHWALTVSLCLTRPQTHSKLLL